MSPLTHSISQSKTDLTSDESEHLIHLQNHTHTDNCSYDTVDARDDKKPLRTLTADAQQAREYVFKNYQLICTTGIDQDIQKEILSCLQQLEEKSMLLGYTQTHDELKQLSLYAYQASCEQQPPQRITKILNKALQKIKKEMDIQDVFLLQTADQKTSYLIKDIHHCMPITMIGPIRELLTTLHQQYEDDLDKISEIDQLLISWRRMFQHIAQHPGQPHHATVERLTEKSLIIEKELLSFYRTLSSLQNHPTKQHPDKKLYVTGYADSLYRALTEQVSQKAARFEEDAPHAAYIMHRKIEQIRSSLLYTASLYQPDHAFIEELTQTVLTHNPQHYFFQYLQEIENIVSQYTNSLHQKRFNYGHLTNIGYEEWLIEQEKKNGYDELVALMEKALDQKIKQHVLRESLISMRKEEPGDDESKQKKAAKIKKLEAKYIKAQEKRRNLGQQILEYKERQRQEAQKNSSQRHDRHNNNK